jgi:putative membrane protein insertion efficiency factor
MNNSSIIYANPSSEPAPARPSAGARTLLRLIALYQRLTVSRVSACRFYPSCSTYAYEAVETHGAWRGAALALRRLLRCRPLGPHGVDLVPLSNDTRSTQR